QILTADSVQQQPIAAPEKSKINHGIHRNARKRGDCSIATGADSKIARQEQGESTWDPLNASELAPNSANGLIPSLIAWAKSQPPGNDAIVSKREPESTFPFRVLPGATPARRVGSFRGYPFVMIFLAVVIVISLARSWGRASGVSRSGLDSVRAAPESSRRRAAGRYARARGGLSTPLL